MFKKQRKNPLEDGELGVFSKNVLTKTMFICAVKK